MNKSILILGGAGYIGSHTAYMLHKLGYEVIILDKLIHNQKFDFSWAKLIKADFSDKQVLEHIFSNYNIEAVMHFAAFIEVGISVIKPKDFYENNVIKTLNFLDIMLKYNVKKFIFSSSCAIYGNPIKVPIDELHPKDPISPYGKNKLIVEYALQDYSKAYDLKYVSLRYFNAAGASVENNLGEQHQPETHIIPLILRAIKNRKEFNVFGTDYKTPDGTCIRDYIHVLDIANAHILALKYLENEGKSNHFNLGSGNGFSVNQMISEAEKVCGQKLKVLYQPRRDGDVDILIADSTKIKSILGWQPRYSDISFIIKTAWLWENRERLEFKLTNNIDDKSSFTLIPGLKSWARNRSRNKNF